MDERHYWLAFSIFPRVGPVKFALLIEHFKTAKSAWEAEEGSLKPILGEKLTEQFLAFRKKFSIERYLKQLEQKQVAFITLQEKEYPELLKQSHHAPFTIYVRSASRVLDLNTFSPAIGVVGTRKITQYGRDVTELLTVDLVAAGFSIVSGLALGVDGVAHGVTIENKGKTIAVLGCGVDCCYPKENSGLYRRIIESGGAIISEVPLSHPPTVGTFPSRNRIVAGLSQGILVTEGAEDSGALITADYAFRNNRKVFAVPGQITSSLSKGPLKLLQQGAKLVTNANDVITELGIKNSELRTESSKTITGDTEEETIILQLLVHEPLHFDEIVRKCGFSSSQAGSILSLLELKGVIKTGANNMYLLT